MKIWYNVCNQYIFDGKDEHTLIQVNHLTKKYGSFLAVDDISFHIEKGHIYGFLGPNGAGKSTTMNIITGCLAATSGEVIIGGFDIYEDPVEAKSHIGYLPEMPPLYTDMTPREYLLFVGAAKGIDPARLTQHVNDIMKKTHLIGVQDRLIKNLSKGYKQRVGIAQAILGDPEIIILDEPTVGLDPLQIIEIRDLIKELGAEHTVILSSHILSEISAVCDTILIISHGRIVASDTIENLTASTDGRRIISVDVRGDMDAVTNALETLQNAVNTTVSHGLYGCIHATVESPANTDLREDVFRLFSRLDIPVLSMSTNDMNLEDVFLRLTSDPVSSQTEALPETPSMEEIPYDADEGPVEDEAEDSPYYEDTLPPKKKKSKKTDDDDDYTPLFGGKQ